MLYNNTAWSGFYGVSTQPNDIHWTDSGRIPSSGGHAGSAADTYLVTAFEVAYCAGAVSGPITLGIDFYGQYAACADPRRTAPDFSISGLSAPGYVCPAPSPLSCISTSTCWLLTFDLAGTSLEFLLRGDGEGSFDGTSSLDTFGWQLHMSNGRTSNLLGPLLAGDPQGYFSGIRGCGPIPEGDGTYYQTGACTHSDGFGGGVYGTGLAVHDGIYMWSPTDTRPNACFWFGGYDAHTPMAAMWMVVYGELSDPPVGTSYCTGAPNSVGAGAALSFTGSNCVADASARVLATSVPEEPGIFFHGSEPRSSAFGCGTLCTGGSLRRGLVVRGERELAYYRYDATHPARSLTGLEGSTRRFQFWYRDPMNQGACGGAFNTSDAVAVPILP